MKRFILLFSFFISFTISIFSSNKYDIVVALDGSGNFSSIQEAVNSVRGIMAERKTIYIKSGIYHEKVVIPTHVTNLTLEGDSLGKTVITWNDQANMILPGEKNKIGTFRTYTLLVQGIGFVAKNLVIENNAPQIGQAVALHVEGDRAEFYNCKILGNQDTIYLGSETCRAYFNSCYIDGTTDFIFGSATGFFEGCEIHSKKNSYITAPSTPKNKEYGLVFYKCKLTSDSNITKVFLGRPWRPYGMSVYIKCKMDKHILPEGWNNWRNSENEKTARFGEIDSYGEGANNKARVKWSYTKGNAKKYTKNLVLAGCDGWKPCNK